ncbi:hypothetical protein [Accumulibacter sp.]|uniref:hypothetical protein n=1 Tax=Accumulibacter sp. TaxID=2053492 RepID=UPI002632F1BB|nr:hypothetical protein [Accumulibacter sp.]
MRLHHSVITVSLAGISAACSPYLYKPEIDAFSKGVNQLAEATRLSVASENAANVTRHRWRWIDERPELALSERCPSGDPPRRPDNRGDTSPQANLGDRKTEGIERDTCGLRHKPLEDWDLSALPFDENVRLMPYVKTLQKYSGSLAAITNAADLDALRAAQVKLAGAVGELVAVAGGEGSSTAREVAPAGPFIGLLNYITTAILDWRRYCELRKAVLRARQSVAVVGTELGKILEELRGEQLVALKATEARLASKLNPDKTRVRNAAARTSCASCPADRRSTVGAIEQLLDEQAYASRLDALQSTAMTLEKLRSSDPSAAADEMVKAHEALAKALEDDTRRQEQAVIEATVAFLEKAEALRASMAALRRP